MRSYHILKLKQSLSIDFIKIESIDVMFSKDKMRQNPIIHAVILLQMNVQEKNKQINVFHS